MSTCPQCGGQTISAGSVLRCLKCQYVTCVGCDPTPVDDTLPSDREDDQ